MSFEFGERRLRIFSESEGKSLQQELADSQCLDAISNPHRLAAALLDQSSTSEEVAYLPFLRSSRLHDVCVREQILGLRSATRITRRIGASWQMVFDFGSAAHEYLQNSSRHFGARLVGWQHCRACGHEFFGRKSAMNCARCGARAEAFRYREHAFALTSPWRLSGHEDGFLECGRGDFRVVDFKTISGTDFDKLAAPKIDHVIQLHGYFLGNDHDRSLPIKINPTKAILFYISKGFSNTKSPFKAFIVDRQSTIEAMIIDQLQVFSEAVANPERVPGPLPICAESNWSAGRARQCPLREVCARTEG